jgi:hypothetical protein
VLAQRPAERDVRQGISMWISDDAGRFAFPRMGVEAIESDWDRRMIQANMAFPDGRVLIGSQAGESHPAVAADGQPRIFGGGPLQFECVEPLRRWKMAYVANLLSRSGRHVLESHRDAAEGRRPGPSPQLTHNSISDNDRRPASIAFHTHRQMMLTPGRPSTYAAYVQNDFGPFLCDSIGVLLQEIQNLGLVASLVATVPR